MQGYALQSYLKLRGHDVYSIQLPTHNSRVIEVKQYIKRLFYRELPVNAVSMKAFQEKYMKETNLVKSKREIENIVTKYGFDAVVVGSDQVWRFLYIKDAYKRYFLDFVFDNNIKKVAFAASFGIDFWEANPTQTYTAAQLIQQFEAVSVRENSGVDLCRDYLGYNRAIHLLDPTLLHPVSFYKKLYTGEEIENPGKIGVYFLRPNEQKKQVVKNFSKKVNTESFSIGSYITENHVEVYYPPVSQWIKDFETAKYIITDSFHGTVFSIMFNKPFCVLGDSGITRLESLLNTFNFKDRLVNMNEMDHLHDDYFFSDIDFTIFEREINNNLDRVDKFFLKVGL